ncbi:hypothetical protein [Aquabacterium sp. OR-4]|uniref:hypothetical protein n=1 Tax=Aquabacterium sp. OR-4 TaxID=2978127 RepID=UPI0028C6C89D|nr:hypothetical protein [Aquabacterium sp. OR-4]MDT7836279.1 hypothetical protein [Aquabacterium sp. OR-4]
MATSKHGTERSLSADDLMSMPSTKMLRETWARTLKAQALEPASVLARGDGKRLHPCYDANLGLNALARAVLLRNVLKTEIRRDHREPSPDAPWQIAIANRTHAFDLFSEKALGTDPSGWLHVDGDNTATLYGLNWRNKLCDGFNGPARVGGLNNWFGSRYRKHLPGGEMTAHLLFETRFSGANAIDNYIKFLLHGIYVPSANHTLSSFAPFNEADLERDPDRGAKLNRLLETVSKEDNGGQPIVTVSCEDNPTAGSRLATTLVCALGERMRSACYVPLVGHGQKGRLNDHGYRSVVEAIYRFVCGESSLVCSDTEHDEAELALMVRHIRRHIVTVPTVFVLDGFSPGVSAFPALISFIRDEPIDRVLRLLQHPDAGDWLGNAGGNLSAFRETYFVIVGTPARQWMEMHRQETVDLQFTARDENEVLGRANMARLREAVRSIRRQQRGGGWAGSESRLNAMSFLLRSGDLPVADDPREIEQLLFDRYWNDRKLKSWQKLFLRALAMSETGLRRSTSLQLFEAYSRLAREPGATNEDCEIPTTVGAEEFRKFIDDACNKTVSAPMLYEYGDGLEADSYDIFDFPSQAISRMTDCHPWITARSQKKDRWLQTVDFHDSSFKRLVLGTVTPNEAIIIRRILAELCLQNYRVRLRHTRTARRIDRRASRNLAEALLHGMMSIEPPRRAQTRAKGGKGSKSASPLPALPKFTQGEIPADPEAAFSFLYSAVFTEMLCDGDPTNISRTHGNGELQLELLMLMGGTTPVGAADRAITHPETSIRTPLWWTDARPEALRHLLAVASSAKRASRVEVLSPALAKIRQLHAKQPLTGLQLLAFRKLRLDLTLLTFDGRTEHKKSWAEALHAIVGCVHGPAAKQRSRRDASALLKALGKLKTDVRGLVVGQQLASRVSTQAIDQMVNLACENILEILPLRKLPKEALTVLTRAAWLESASGDRLDRQGDSLAAFQHNITSMAYFWLGKALAVRLRTDSAAANPRVGFSATEGYVRTVIKLTEYLETQDGTENNQFRDRLYKSARSMLDTYAREQGVNKADHIAAVVLECTYVRAILPPTKVLALTVRADSPTGDERLTSLSRCLQWLRQAEQEMLSFSGQPAIRVMLCRERIFCLIDMLRRLAEHFEIKKVRVKRLIDESDGAPFKPLVDILINDLRQYRHFIGFMKSYSPAARYVIDEWTQDRDHLLSLVKSSVENWRAHTGGPYNQALDMLSTLE